MKKKSFERLISFHLVEWRDEELDNELGHFVWHWTYPSIENDTRSFIEKRLYSKASHLAVHGTMGKEDESRLDNFDFYRLNSYWAYMLYGSSHQRHVVILLARDFCPHSYRKLLYAFVQLYEQKTPLPRVLHYYLTLLIDEQIMISEMPDLKLDLSASEAEDALGVGCAIKEIVTLFHLDVILIYTALLLKRKIAIYHHSQSKLLDFMFALPAFIAHRAECSSDILFPNVDLHSAEQIDGLRDRNHFIATFHDSKIEEREDLYDIYVNLAAVEITISHHARDVFSMTKTHKEVAIALVRAAENETITNEQMIQEITKKTRELCNSLLIIANEGCYSQTEANAEISEDGTKMALPPSSLQQQQHPPPSQLISKEKLKQKLLSPNLESFYWNLAVAEGIADVISP